MSNNLQSLFPVLRTRQELLREIQTHSHLFTQFQGWSPDQQEEFLDFCTGVKGVKMLYDSFFKEIMNPETTPERLEEFLSLVLKQKVTILKVLPNDSTRIADESSLLIMDIVVELSDGSIANVEVQKIGYAFPGQRCACYSADLLLRQYKRVRSEKKKLFSYRDIKKVYTIILFEKSTKEFHEFPNIYIHHSEQKSDTGLKLELLQDYTFITLDIFRKNLQNKGISNQLDAWLTFLSVDEPEMIVNLITTFPQFKSMYDEVYQLCRNTEKVMGMFSKELQDLDRNTVQYMIDEMQDTIDAQQDKIDAQQDKIDAQQDTIDEQQNEIVQQKNALLQKDNQLQEQQLKLSEMEQELLKLRKKLSK